ncbi:MAG: DUF1501 domain-containing protein [Planctomycetales bacterium]|nr:DUF1501 domain-containing protein [Planctomycetales bacterium]
MPTPRGMSRRHFMQHAMGAASMASAAFAMGNSVRVHAQELKRQGKAAILLWMSGGPATIDLWDLKPGAPTGGPFRPINTSGDVQICEHLPTIAKQMHNLTVVRSMSTREADHARGRYYMHTGYVPNPNIEHPSYGAVISHELMRDEFSLEIPPFISIGGASEGPGFLGMSWAPFNVSSDGQIRNLEMGLSDQRLMQRMFTLQVIENGFVAQNRGSAAVDHQKVLKKTFDLITSQQMKAFDVKSEPDSAKALYGDTGFGRGCLLARRLVEAGVPFVEVELGGWDNHQNIHTTLQNQKLPELDQAMGGLMIDLEQRGLLEKTVVIWMGEFGRTPTINGNAGRDHWAKSWSVVLGGGGIRTGIAIGETDDEGRAVVSTPYTAEDLMTSVCKALGISLETTFQSKNGRPMKIAGGGKLIEGIFA